METRPDGWIEGVWDGDFEAFDFDNALTLVGSGGRVRGDRVMFAAPFHPLERLFVMRDANQILVSNSLVFLLRECGDALDIGYPGYYFDIQEQVWRGIAPPPARLPTAAGRYVELYPCSTLEVTPDLAITITLKPAGKPPRSFADYDQLLVSTARALANNAASPHRQRKYEFIAACSRGYDSTAAAAIVSRAGCREGVTFKRGGSYDVHPLVGAKEVVVDDDGAVPLRALGMTPHAFDRLDVKRLPGHPRAEFFISPIAATDSSAAVMEAVLPGRILVSGRHGERYWSLGRRSARENFREPDDCYLSGHSLGEFRLRVGFLHFPMPYVGARHGPAIYRITHSPEMQPWTLGSGYYDRPIPRRIGEEAGVPRGAFGQKKHGALLDTRDLSEHSDRDFRAFVDAEVPRAIRRALDPRRLTERADSTRRFSHVRTHYAHWPLAGAALRMFGVNRLHPLAGSIYQYQFHWGFAKLADRYPAARR